jgi:hypothetical protein
MRPVVWAYTGWQESWLRRELPLAAVMETVPAAWLVGGHERYYSPKCDALKSGLIGWLPEREGKY